MTADKCTGNFAHRKTTQKMKNERDLPLFRNSRMTAREHHAKHIVFDRGSGKELFHRRHQRPFTVEQTPQFGRIRARSTLAAEHVERSVLCCRHQPCRWVLRDTAEFPDL